MTSLNSADRGHQRFSDLLLSHRGRTRLTQRQLASRVGVAMRSVQDWELGVNYPTAQRLQALIAALLEADGMIAGHELVEARELWAAVLRDAPRMHTPIDERWLASLLRERAAPPAPADPVREVFPPAPVAVSSAVRASERRQNWGDAPDVLGFVGRIEELAVVRDWVLGEHCRLVGVLGIGGIGKTRFAAKMATDVAPAFKCSYWRSLRNAPPVSEWLGDAIGFLSDQRLVAPDGEAARFKVVLEMLRERPCLLVLDNFETVLEPRAREGRYRAGFAGYGSLLRAIGETAHQSCIVVTSRETPPELAVLSGTAVRSLDLGGLGIPECQVMLSHKQLSGTGEDWASLIARFGGNGLALKLVSESIRQLFGGDISAFIEVSGSGAIFGGIRRLLAEQIDRSSALEQDVLRVLAIEREPVTITKLIAELGPRAGRGALLEAVEALRRRSLVEPSQATGTAAFTLQSVVLEYVTDRLVESTVEEIERERPLLLMQHALVKAHAKDYVRRSQERLIAQPVVEQLEARTGTPGDVKQLLVNLLRTLSKRPTVEHGFGPGNLVNLLRLHSGDLRELDLSGLVLRDAHLRDVEAQDTSLAGASLIHPSLAEAFQFPNRVVFSADCTHLLAGTSDGELCLWSVADQQLLLKIHAHAGQICGIDLSDDARVMASASLDQSESVKVWAGPGGERVSIMSGPSGAAWNIALTADGKLLGTAHLDGKVHLWEAQSGRLLATLEHDATVFGFAMTRSGQLLASGTTDGGVHLWDGPTRERLASLRGHTAPVVSMAISADGKLVASGSRDGTVKLWDVAQRELRATLAAHSTDVFGVWFSNDSRILASGGFDEMVNLWEVDSGRRLLSLHAHTGGVTALALNSGGQLMASASQDGTIKLWDISVQSMGASADLVAILQGCATGLSGVGLSSDGSRLVSGCQDGTVKLWDAASGQLLRTLRGHAGRVFSAAISGDGQLVVSGSQDKTAIVWDPRTGAQLAVLRGHDSGVWDVALSHDGRLTVTGSYDGTIRLWKTDTGGLLATLAGHGAHQVHGVTLSRDDSLLASAGEDGTLKLWDVASGRLLHTLQNDPVSAAWGVALSKDSRRVFGGHLNGTIDMWDVETGRLLMTLEAHSSAVWGLALSKDDKLLVTGSWDSTVKLWEISTRRLLATLEGHAGMVLDVALSEDGQIVASAGDDGTVRLWRVSSGELLRTLRAERRYERTDITGLRGITQAQRQTMIALGAVDRNLSLVDESNTYLAPGLTLAR